MKFTASLLVVICLAKCFAQEGQLQEEGMEDAPATYLGGMMSSFFQRFEKMSDTKRRTEFNKVLPSIDANNDAEITFEEIKAWVLKNVEDEAKSLDFSRLEILNMDTDNDGKLSWKEMENDHRKQLAQTSGKEGYFQMGKELKREKVRFDHIDKNKDGFITPDEFPRLVLPDNFEDMSEVAVDHYVLDFDEDNDGEVSKAEFIKHARRDPNIDDPEQHFKTHDKNKDGILSKDELRDHALESTSSSHFGYELKAIFKLLDKNADGVLSYNELSKGYKYFTDLKESLPNDAIENAHKDEL